MTYSSVKIPKANTRNDVVNVWKNCPVSVVSCAGKFCGSFSCNLPNQCVLHVLLETTMSFYFRHYKPQHAQVCYWILIVLSFSCFVLPRSPNNPFIRSFHFLYFAEASVVRHCTWSIYDSYDKGCYELKATKINSGTPQLQSCKLICTTSAEK